MKRFWWTEISHKRGLTTPFISERNSVTVVWMLFIFLKIVPEPGRYFALPTHAEKTDVMFLHKSVINSNENIFISYIHVHKPQWRGPERTHHFYFSSSCREGGGRIQKS